MFSSAGLIDARTAWRNSASETGIATHLPQVNRLGSRSKNGFGSVVLSALHRRQ
jgi:hypothetical protein